MIPLSVRVDNLDTRTTSQFAFIKSPVRVGRSELNDLPLTEPFVSQWHGLIQFDESRITFLDLGSTNGTTLNGTSLDKNVTTEIGPGSELRIGSIRLILSRRATGQRPGAPRPKTQFALRASSLANVPVAPPAPPPPVSREMEIPAPPPPPPEPEIDLVQQTVDEAAEQISGEYEAYRQARQKWQDSMEELASGIDQTMRDRAVALLRERFPAIGGEDGAARAGAGEIGVAGGLGSTAIQLIQAFAESYLPMATPISSVEVLQSFLGRIAEVLESYSKSFVELRKGYDEFGREMAIRTVHGDTPIHRAKDHRQVLAYLLEGRADGQRIQELQGAFADLMIHQVALLNGVMQGAQGMLGQLSPDTIVGEVSRLPPRAWPPSAWPFGTARFWQAYVARHREIADEESSVSQALFGKEFARAYSAVVGQRSDEPGEGASHKRPPRASAGPRTYHDR
jgi:predicted component of type VI protein secretion system